MSHTSAIRRVLPIALTAIAATSSCNSDIFIGDTRPSESFVTLEGDGGSATISCQARGLLSISIDDSDNNIFHTSYFGSDGEEIGAGSPMELISHIRFESAFALLDLVPEGSALKLHSIEQASGADIHSGLRLDYGSHSEYIGLLLLPGDNATAVDTYFFMDDMTVSPLVKVEKRSIHYANSSDSPIRAGIRPYESATPRVLMEPQEFFGRGLETDTRIPTNNGENWGLYGISTKLTLGEAADYATPAVDPQLTVWLEIPPQTTVTGTCNVRYSACEVPFLMTLQNPVSGRINTITGLSTSAQPTSYHITIDE